MFPVSAAVGASLAVLALMTLLLSVLVFRKYRSGLSSYLWWGTGIFLGFVTITQEAALVFGYWSQPLIRTYIFLVALLVGVMSVGSVNLLKNGWIRATWFGYVVLMSIATAYFSFTTPVGRDVLVGGVLLGTLPSIDILFSTLLTAPAALALIALALYSTLKTRRLGTLFIAAGGIVLSISGALFAIRSFPALLYYAEFVGVLLLFIGFIEFPSGHAGSVRTWPAPSAGRRGGS